MKSIIMRIFIFFSLLIINGNSYAQKSESQKSKIKPPPAKPISVLCLGREAPNMREFIKDKNIHLGSLSFKNLTWEKLQQYNVVIIFCMGRYDKDSKREDIVEIGPAGFKRVSDLLERYVKAGGGLYVYGVSFTHMGQGWPATTLNGFLKRFDVQVPFEQLHDKPKEKRQEKGKKVLYAQADKIDKHPVTSRVKNYWYAIGRFCYGPWVRPIKFGSEWQGLIFTSKEFESLPLKGHEGYGAPIGGAVSQIKTERACIYALRKFGKGRIVLNGGESTISFFNYRYSAYADRMWERIGMEKGINGIKSNGLELMVDSLRWLAQPSLKLGMGGYRVPPPKGKVINNPKPIAWKPCPKIGHQAKYIKGVIGAIPKSGGGKGTVKDFVDKAKKMGLDYVVFTGYFEKMKKDDWDKLVKECQKSTTSNFAAVPALITQDEQDNSFVQAGAKSWPKDIRLSKKMKKRVKHHLGYWMNDSNFPFRAPFNFSKGKYPGWLFSGINAFGAKTYKNGKLIDENLKDFLSNNEQGCRLRIININLVDSPQQLAKVKDFTYLRGNNPEQVAYNLTKQHWHSDSYISSGPIIDAWVFVKGSKNTYGVPYAAGHERWQYRIKTHSDVPLKSIKVYDGEQLFREFDPTGTREYQVNIEGLHDKRHVLTTVIEDIKGRQAISGTVETCSSFMRQTFCSDRCNIMLGYSTVRNPDGSEMSMPATTMLYKAGRLMCGTVGLAESLPGIDGSGTGAEFGLHPNFFINAENKDKTEVRPIVHKIIRPYESDDLIIFDTPILYRSTDPGHVIFGHNPYVNLVKPKIKARLKQYHFYRNPPYPSPAMVELDMEITDPEGIKLKKGWNDFSARFSGTWANHARKYVILRSDNSIESGPGKDGKTNMTWRGDLNPGDAVIFPDIQEGFLVLKGKISIRIESVPKRKWFRMYTGRYDTPELKKSDKISCRLLMLKTNTADDVIKEWKKVRNLYGIGNTKPAYQINVTNGKILSQKYLLEIKAETPGVTCEFTETKFPQRLPVKITGLQNNCTTAKVPLAGKREWFPIGVTPDGTAYTTFDLNKTNGKWFIGNLVTANNSKLKLTLLPPQKTSPAIVKIHNPTEKEIVGVITIPLTTWLVPKQTHQVKVPAKQTIELILKGK